MKPERKRKVIELVHRSPVEKKQTLGDLGLRASTYYRWQRRYRDEGETGLMDRWAKLASEWNRMKPEEELAPILRFPAIGAKRELVPDEPSGDIAR